MKENISCPKCGFKQESMDECLRCGVIFSKFRPATNRPEKPAVGVTLPNKKRPSGTWGITMRILRVFFLLVLLFIAGMSTWLTRLRSTDWDLPLRIVIYPINGDGSSVTTNYINLLKTARFNAIEDFMREEAAHYGLKLRDPIAIALAPEVKEVPPRPPQGGSVVSVMLWSLRLRYWASMVDTYRGPAADIRMFVVFFDPAAFERLADSLGLQKGLIGVVYAFAGSKQEARDNAVITHELLHTLGATDKYDRVTGQPLYPDGYAEPERRPLFPQDMAEIMGGRLPLDENRAKMPASLDEIVIGEKTAAEINWIE